MQQSFTRGNHATTDDIIQQDRPTPTDSQNGSITFRIYSATIRTKIFWEQTSRYLPYCYYSMHSIGCWRYSEISLTSIYVTATYAMVTCKIKFIKKIISKFFQPSSITRLKKFCALKLFQNYFRGLLQFMNIFRHVQCCWYNFEIILGRRNNFEIVWDVVTCEIKHWNYFKIISFHM